MEQEKKEFFARAENKRILREFVRKLEDISPAIPPGIDADALYRNLVQMIRVIHANPEQFDSSCPYNIKHIGAHFMNEMDTFSVRPDEGLPKIPSIFTSAYRFICEFEFSLPEDSNLSLELRAVVNFVHENLEVFTGPNKNQILYAQYLMPAQIVKMMIAHPDVANVRLFNEKIDSASKLKKDWDKEIEEKEGAVNVIKDALEGYKTGFNFVGLIDGFRQLTKKKEDEKSAAFRFLVVMGLLALTPISAEIIYLLFGEVDIELVKGRLIYAIPSLIAIEVLLVYFFRIVLLQYRSIKAQLLQLELRMTLCQFIQSYATYAGKIKAEDKTSLEKFENLIFSGLISNEEKLPSTFDGMEQLINLVKATKQGN